MSPEFIPPKDQTVNIDPEAIAMMSKIESTIDVEYLTPWIGHDYEYGAIDYIRLGRDRSTGHPGFSSVVLYEGKYNSCQEWRKLVDEEQLQSSLDHINEFGTL